MAQLNGALTGVYKRFGSVVSSHIQPILQEQPIVRRLLVRSEESGKGIGHRRLETMEYKDLAEAVTDMQIRDDIYDTYNIGGSYVEIPIQQAMIHLKYRDLAAMSMSGYDITSETAGQTTINVALKLDDDVLFGWGHDGPVVRAPGIITRAGLNVAGSSFGTFGNAMKAVSAAMAMLSSAKIVFPSFNLLVNPVQYYQLLASYGPNGELETDIIRKLLNSMGVGGGVGDIISANQIPEGEAYIMLAPLPGQSRFYSLLEAIDPFIEIFPDTNSNVSDVSVRIMTAGVFLCHYIDASTGTTNSIVKITGIS